MLSIPIVKRGQLEFTVLEEGEAKQQDYEYYVNPEFWEDDERYDKWSEITDERWGW